MLKIFCDNCGKEIKNNNYRVSIGNLVDGNVFLELCDGCKDKLEESISWIIDKRMKKN